MTAIQHDEWCTITTLRIEFIFSPLQLRLSLFDLLVLSLQLFFVSLNLHVVHLVLQLIDFPQQSLVTRTRGWLSAGGTATSDIIAAVLEPCETGFEASARCGA